MGETTAATALLETPEESVDTVVGTVATALVETPAEAAEDTAADMVATSEEMAMVVATARVGMVRMVAVMAIVATPKAITLVKRGTHTTHEREIDDRFLLYERTIHPIYMQQDSKIKKSDVTWRGRERERKRGEEGEGVGRSG